MVRLMIVLPKMYGKMNLVIYLQHLPEFSGTLILDGMQIVLEQQVLMNMLL